MGKFVIIVFAIILLVFAIFDLIATPKDRVKVLPKPLWFVILLAPLVGPALWLAFGRTKPAAPPKPSGGWAPPHRPPGPKGPDDDPDYLHGL
ncbi:hypothetical protein GCM10022234_20960 [Aeromicrobium panaciterrae]|uniref:PLD nuclease N-terminal domain-containing protein n=1 Tax=Aeromicrobium panaciterrae TaxID=363861 RepID=UPI0031D58044